MYHTGNYYLQRKQTTPAIPHGSNLGSPRISHPFFDDTRTVDYHDGGLRRNQTMPTDTTSEYQDDERDIQRTGSGGFLFFRKRTEEERKVISQQRAAQMIVQFELSEQQPESLNRKPKFGSDPMLGTCLVAQQLALASMKQQKNAHEVEKGPPGELKKGKTGGLSKPSRPPLKSKGNAFTFDHVKPTTQKKSKSQQRIDIARATRMRLVAEEAAARAEGEIPHEIGADMTAVVSPGVYSTATTLASTPSPRPIMPGTKLHATQEIHRLC